MLTVLRHHDERPITSACRVATGRSAILHMALRWNPECVFMPCYVPEGVLQPFIVQGAQIVFYKLDHWLRPDFGDLTTKMEASKGERPVIVLIHYFGMRASIFEAEKIAARHGGIVLSDCAHCVPYGDGYWKADLTLYSLNKILPVSDGALLSCRREDLNISLQEDALSPLPRHVLDWYDAHLRANFAVSKQLPHHKLETALMLSGESYERYYAGIQGMELRAQSALSRSIEAETDLNAMKRLRWAQSDDLCGQLLPQFFMLDQSCQFAFPIRCDGKRDEIAAALQEAGILASTCEDKWDHIPSEGFSVERNFISDHLLLPLGESVRCEDISLMADVVNSFGRRA